MVAFGGSGAAGTAGASSQRQAEDSGNRPDSDVSQPQLQSAAPQQHEQTVGVDVSATTPRTDWQTIVRVNRAMLGQVRI